MTDQKSTHIIQISRTATKRCSKNTYDKISEGKVKKLALGGDFRTWSSQIELHFREPTQWDHALYGKKLRKLTTIQQTIKK